MFRGVFKFHSATGKPYQYTEGDTVVYEGKVYFCGRATEMSPLQAPNCWGFIGMTEAVVSANAPLKPVEGQEWIDDNGRSFKWFTDANGSQWLQT